VKGTPLYDRLQSQGRILNSQDIDRWSGQLCYITPPYGTAAQLEQNVEKMCREFYSLPSIISRLPLPLTKADMASWFINFSQRRMGQAGPANNNFDGY
jgi:hypothetical protein